jgi:hypothetical protein
VPDPDDTAFRDAVAMVCAELGATVQPYADRARRATAEELRARANSPGAVEVALLGGDLVHRYAVGTADGDDVGE